MLKKICILLLIFGVMLGSGAGYVFLNNKIAEGEIKIADGKKQITQGELKLARGKERLKTGQEQLSQGKNVHVGMKAASVAAVTVMPVSAAVVVAASEKMTGNKISAGDKLLAEGKEKVRRGEQRLAAGKVELQRGIKVLNLANYMRNALAVSTILFALLFVFMIIYWRNDLNPSGNRKSD